VNQDLKAPQALPGAILVPKAQLVLMVLQALKVLKENWGLQDLPVHQDLKVSKAYKALRARLVLQEAGSPSSVGAANTTTT
jgi:hypothetical protein